MHPTHYARVLLVALPLVACASERTHTGTEPPVEPQAEQGVEAHAAAELALPEVRYYMIADT